MTRVLVVAALAALAGCFPAGSYECDLDSDCSGGEACARSHECLPPSEMRAVRIRWTLDGQVDTATGCPALGLNELTIQFSGGDGGAVMFSPVPCVGGLFSIDKLPTRFNQVELYGGGYYGVTILGSDPEYTLTLAPN